MRIGYIVSKYPAVSHTFVQREVLGLRKLGWDVVTFSIRRAGQKELLTDTDRSEAKSTHVVVGGGVFRLIASVVGALLWMPGRFLRALGCAWKMRRPGLRGALWAMFYFVEALIVHRICYKKGIQHLHAHFANVASDVAMIATVLNAGTFSYTMHGPTEFFDIGEHRLAEKTRAAKLVVCISDFARSQLMSMVSSEHWGKLRVVHCGVDPEQFATVRQQGHVESEGGGGGARPTEILCIARLAPVKGHAVLFQAVAELGLRGHDVRVTIAGDGPLRQELERLVEVVGIANRVKFLGNVGQDVIHKLYAQADMFVLPSFAEGVPVVLMEAMAAKCPVIATRIAGIGELIEHGATGLLVNPGRADYLADAVERNLVNARAADRMALAGCEKVQREFNLNLVAPQLAGIFGRTLEGMGMNSADVAGKCDTAGQVVGVAEGSGDAAGREVVRR